MFALLKVNTGKSGFSLFSVPLLLIMIHWLSKSWIGTGLSHLQTLALEIFLIAWVAWSVDLYEARWLGCQDCLGWEKRKLSSIGSHSPLAKDSLHEALLSLFLISDHSNPSHPWSPGSNATLLQRCRQSPCQQVAPPSLKRSCISFVSSSKYFSPSLKLSRISFVPASKYFSQSTYTITPSIL